MNGKLLFFLLFFFSVVHAQQSIKTEVLVIGGGTGGTAAGIQSARSGVSTITIEPTNMLGGMLTAAGVSCTDGNDDLPSGMWEEFRQALHQHYGKKNLATGWVSNTCFEPHVGDSIFKAWAAKEKKLQVLFGWHFIKVLKQNKKVIGAVFANNTKQTLTIKSLVTIDATELGDVFANAGAKYYVGMDDPKITGEKEARNKNNIIQDLTWVATLKDYGSAADKTIAKPANYDPKKYYCCNTNAPCTDKPWNGDKQKMLNYGKLPNNKYMLNWPAHGNDYYLNVIENNYEERNKKYELAKQNTLGFIYFLQTELGMKNIGLADDELNGGLALIPYNREGRIVKGVVRLTIDHLKNPYNYTLYKTGIAVGNYPVDHHHAQYPGKVPEIEFPPIPAYTIPIGCLIPEKVNGLIVCEKGISVSNIVNGTTRLQPVVLLTGQAAGILAALSVQEKKEARKVEVRMVQENLLKAKCYLMPFSDVKRDDVAWEAIQRIGVTGILKGTGKAQGWENKMFFYPDSTIASNNFLRLIHAYKNLKEKDLNADTTALSISKAFELASKLNKTANEIIDTRENVERERQNLWQQLRLRNYESGRPITRRELALLCNYNLQKN
ncbi:MAG: FAD-dependent oxidoreductase [Chitinophagaceae bacterium]